MLLLAAILLLIVHVSSEERALPANYGQYAWWDAPNGKLAREMRTFTNATFDWSSRKFDGRGTTVIPQCHEYRIRMSFFEHYMKDMALTEKSLELMNSFPTGHYVYPLVLTVEDGTSPPRGYFAVAVHKGFSFQDSIVWSDLMKLSRESNGTIMEKRPDLVRIVIVTEDTWKSVWSHWKTAIEQGMDLCNNTSYFENFIARIDENEKERPQYDDLIANYTDVMSEFFGSSGYGVPLHQQEKLTFGFPTAEGAHQLLITHRTNGFIPNVLGIREVADGIMRIGLSEYYYKTKQPRLEVWSVPIYPIPDHPAEYDYFYNVPQLVESNHWGEKILNEEGIRRHQCVFRRPYC